ncbi:MAG: MBL fold metallo-hydrolase [Acetobacteraceae bacterium]|nr:MBL fold metallo-hydrolase [Acetobacteraceae bacterium]MSP31084.1 MBL fold metallo-hydrolase [Acetobacteraceae bacterium]
MGALKAVLLPVTPYQQNTTLLWDEATKQAVVIDPGGEVPRILAAIDQLGLNVATILLTHGHMDHAGGADELRAALRDRVGDPAAAPIVGPDSLDEFLLANLARQGAATGLNEARNVQPDRWLSEGDIVQVGEHKFQVLHCPGHTPGHVVFVNTDARVAIVGDVLFQGSVGRTDFPYGDHNALIHAIKTKLLPLGDDIGFACGHGPGSSFGQERLNNPFLQS